MADVNAIAKNLRLIVNKGREIEDNIILCTVNSVSGLYCEVQPIDESLASIPDVRLASELHDTNFFIIPTVDSVVGVLAFSDIETTDYYVAMFSEIDSIKIRGDQYDGLVKVGDLVTKLNNIENKVNLIISTFNAHVHGGAPTATPVAGTLTTTVQADLENTAVTHG